MADLALNSCMIDGKCLAAGSHLRFLPHPLRFRECSACSTRVSRCGYPWKVYSRFVPKARSISVRSSSIRSHLPAPFSCIRFEEDATGIRLLISPPENDQASGQHVVFKYSRGLLLLRARWEHCRGHRSSSSLHRCCGRPFLVSYENWDGLWYRRLASFDLAGIQACFRWYWNFH